MKLSVSLNTFPESFSDQLWPSYSVASIQLSVEISKDSGSTTFSRDFDVSQPFANQILLDFNKKYLVASYLSILGQ